MRVQGEYHDFLESRGAGCFTPHQIRIIEKNLQAVPGPIPTVYGWFRDRHSLSSWIALVKKQWITLDGPIAEKRGVRTNFRTQMRARWTPSGSTYQDRDLDRAVDRVFFVIIRHLYELDPKAIKLEDGRKGYRRNEPEPARTELLRQCLMAEGFAVTGEQRVDYRHMKYVRPNQRQIEASLAVLSQSGGLPLVKDVSRRTGKQYKEDWKAMRTCVTFEGVELNTLHHSTYNVVHVQLFRYWLFFHSGGHVHDDSSSSQAMTSGTMGHRPTLATIVNASLSLKPARAALRTTDSSLSPSGSMSIYSQGNDSYHTVTARSERTYSPASNPWVKGGDDINYEDSATLQAEDLEMISDDQAEERWRRSVQAGYTRDHIDNSITSESRFWPPEVPLSSPTSQGLWRKNHQEPTDRPQVRDPGEQSGWDEGTDHRLAENSPMALPLPSPVFQEKIEFIWGQRVFGSAAFDLEEIRTVMHMLRALDFSVCDNDGRFVDPQYCLSSGMSKFDLKRK